MASSLSSFHSFYEKLRKQAAAHPHTPIVTGASGTGSVMGSGRGERSRSVTPGAAAAAAAAGAPFSVGSRTPVSAPGQFGGGFGGQSSFNNSHPSFGSALVSPHFQPQHPQQFNSASIGASAAAPAGSSSSASLHVAMASAPPSFVTFPPFLNQSPSSSTGAAAGEWGACSD